MPLIPKYQEQQIIKLKRFLEGWKMVLLPLKSILLWEQQWHPCAIFILISIFYFFIWIMDLNVLATFAFICLFINFVDFWVPVVCNSMFDSTAWTGQKEKMYEDICENIVVMCNKTLLNLYSFYSLRETRPCVYYIISFCMMCTVSWIASSVNNTFLLYILTTGMLLWPGLQCTGMYNSVLSFVNLGTKLPFLKSD